MEALYFIFSDIFWFSVIEAALCLITLWALLRKTIARELSPVTAVFRGEESRNFLKETFFAALTILISVVFFVSTFPKDGKVMLYIFNVFLIVYICFWNGWSTNKLIELKNCLEKRDLNPHN